MGDHGEVIPSYTTILTAGHTESSFLFLTVSNTYELIHTRILSRHTQDGTHIISRFINIRLIGLLIDIVKQVTNLDKRTHGQAKQVSVADIAAVQDPIMVWLG